VKNIVALEPGAGIKMETECNELYEYHVVDQVSVLKKKTFYGRNLLMFVIS